MTRKEKRTYYFSVEGDTEKWYLEWLQRKINENAGRKYEAKFVIKVARDPTSWVKRLNILEKTEITHVCDMESTDPAHMNQFHNTLSCMKDIWKQSGKSVSYSLGYSNFTFELWIILHKKECNGCLAHRDHYLDHLNSAFDERFESLGRYKQERNFSGILDKLSLEDVRDAISRAESLMRSKDANQRRIHKGYKYYPDNPALSIWEAVKRILKECGLL